MFPRQPQLRLPGCSGSDNRQTIKPASGVNKIEMKNAHPNPILRLAPINPTKAATKVSVNNPNNNKVSAIGIIYFAKIENFSQKLIFLNTQFYES